MRSVLVPVFALLSVAVGFPTPSAAQRLPGRVLDISVGEYFINAPDSISAGLITLRLTQTGDVVKPFPADTAKLRADPTYHLHMIWLVRLDSGKTVSDVLEAEREDRPAPWSKILGGPGFVDAPGASNVTMLLAEGNYALVCYVGSAREDRNRYHLPKGMIRPLTVTAAASGKAEPMPAADIEIVLAGDSVQVRDTLAAGRWRVLVRNERERPAEFGIGRLKPGYTVEQARAWRGRFLTEPPRIAIGGVVYIIPKQALLTTVDLTAGDYMFGGKHVVVR